MDKPSIVDVIGDRLALRKAGREYTALCPFHYEKSPSFTVNEDKGLFYCFGCGAKGDAFSFIMQLDGLSFPEARAQLGIASQRPTPKRRDPIKSTAATITKWANDSTAMVSAQLREIGQRERIARLVSWRDEIDLLDREWAVLETLTDDLQDQALVIGLWRERETVERLAVAEADCG